MRSSRILAKTRGGQPARLAMMGHFLPPFIAYAAAYGFDGVWIDLEHRAMDPREVQALLAFCHLYDIDGVVRAPTREKALLYRYLEDGAAGLIIPHVSEVEAAAALAQAVKFPPLGDRGLEGRGLEANFGLDTTAGREALVGHALRETFLIVQIETPAGLEAADSIAALPGIDGLYVGPADLGLRLQQSPLDAQVTVAGAIERVAGVCRRHHKLWGALPRTPGELRQHVALGSQFLVWGIDGRMLQEGLDLAGKELDSILI